MDSGSDSMVASAERQRKDPASPASSGLDDDGNPYAPAARLPRKKMLRRLKAFEIIGATIAASSAAVGAFFIAFFGGLVIVSGILSNSPDRASIGTGILFATLFIAPMTIAVLAFVWVFRDSRKY
jgi:hypothetical protein